MNNQKTTVSHNGATYDLDIGKWLRHLHSELSEALFEIAKEEIILPNGQKAGIYKAERKAEYENQSDKSSSSAKKHLNNASRHDFNHGWDDLIHLLKKKINDKCVPLLVGRYRPSMAEQQEILKAASNGHVSAMYWIGTHLSSKKDDNCLLWLTMAHNQGHVGACYEMAGYLMSEGNHKEAIRCLIVSADGGSDLAYMSIFGLKILVSMFKIGDVDLLENMLDELAITHSSSARYLKGMLRLFQGRHAEAVVILEEFAKCPKKQPPIDNIDTVYENQIKAVTNFIRAVLVDISSSVQPLESITNHGKEAGFIEFEDYYEIVAAVEKEILSRQ